jgi:hypothetical protein
MDRSSEAILRIEQNVVDVQARISQAAERAGRSRDGVRLVAISKGQSVEKIRAAYHVGIRDFGENRIHEALPKLTELEEYKDIRWHMVGHIQSRKARSVIPAFTLVHSVDRWKLAQRLDRFAGEGGIKLAVLLECNVSGELAKYGWNLQDETSWSSVLPEFERILDFKNIDIHGLMTMAPWITEERILRSCFIKLRELRSFLSSKLPGSWKELSMGMTDDFEFAIEEGATIVRIGRAIFGERQTN